MEQVIAAVRRLWFGALEVNLGWGTLLSEVGGELVTMVNGDPAELDARLPFLASRSTYVVVTDFSRPPDLADRLSRFGFRPVQRQVTYVLDAPASDSVPLPAPAERPRLLGLFRRPMLALGIEEIDRSGLERWNSVCWRAFGSRGTEEASLLEKESAYRATGAAGRWYLACAGSRPVGTAMCYQDEKAAQVLAVGTLPAYRGKGVATALMARLIGDWQRSGRGFLFLDTTPGGAAERLYIRLGFRRAYARVVFGTRG